MNHLFGEIRSHMPAADTLFIETSAGLKLSYGQMMSATARYANALVGLGVKPGDRVAVQLEKSPAGLFIYLACVRAGAIYLPLNTAYTLNELDYFIGDAEPAVVICDPAKHAGIAELGARHGVKAVVTHGTGMDGTLFDLAAAAAPDFADVARGPDDLAAILYTSGTTGRSKGAMMSHENLASNARVLVDYWRFTGKDVLLHALPIFHTHGLFVATNVILFAGASMLFLPKFDADEVFRLLPKATAMMGVPTFYFRMLQDERLTPEATKHMRLFISGSAPLLEETHREFERKTGLRILERYGMTETNMLTSNPYDGERVAGTVGFPLPGVTLRVVNPETGEKLATEEIGMIEVSGPNVFKGYWRMPEKTKSEFRPDGYLITGDIGKIDAKGYVSIVGRGKDLVITGGYNVYPKEIEVEIDQLPGVVESAVIGVPHPDFGEGVTAVVVAKKGAQIDEKAVLGALDGKLAKFKQPKRVFFLDDLPRNTMGKVQKNILREQYKAIYS